MNIFHIPMLSCKLTEILFKSYYGQILVRIILKNIMKIELLNCTVGFLEISIMPRDYLLILNDNRLKD